MFGSSNGKRSGPSLSSDRRRRNATGKSDQNDDALRNKISSRKSSRGDDRAGKRGDDEAHTSKRDSKQSTRTTSSNTSYRTAPEVSGQGAASDSSSEEDAKAGASRTRRKSKSQSLEHGSRGQPERRRSVKESQPARTNKSMVAPSRSSRALDTQPPDRAPSEEEASSLVPNQFPGQTPQDFSLPYRPAPSDSLGAAADYYGDQGESVGHQPGIRPATPIVTGTEPHLMAALPHPAPPQETGSGSAAEFYNPSGIETSVPSVNPSGTTLNTQPRPPGPSTTMSTVSETNAHTSSHANASLYGAGAAAGALGLSAAAYSHHHQYNQRPPSNASIPTMTTSGAPLGHTHSYPGHYPTETYEPRGPFGKFVDWWQDYEDVRKMEEYMQYIGVCRYCFDPQTSVWDAPRRHKPSKRTSRESLNRRRVRKSGRHHSPDTESRKLSGTRLVAAGLAGAGVVEATRKTQKRRSFDDFDLQNGQPERSSEGPGRRISSHPVKRSLTEDGTRGESRSSGSLIRRESRGHTSHTLRGPRASIDRIEGNKIYVDSQFSGPTQAGSTRSRSSIIKQLPPRPMSEIEEMRMSASRQTRSSSSSSERDVKPGFWTRLFSPSSNKSRKHDHPRRRRQGGYSHSNSSGSSLDTHLAYGTTLSGFKAHGSRKRDKSPEVSARDARNAILGLGAAAAALNAHSKRDQRDLRKGIPPSHAFGSQNKRDPSRQDRKVHDDENPRAPTPDGWVSASEDDDAASIDSGLAFGGSTATLPKLSTRGSAESLSSQNSGAEKWDWRWKQKTQLPKGSDANRSYGANTPGWMTSNLAQSQSGREQGSKPSNSRTAAAAFANVDPRHGYDDPTPILPGKDLPLQQPQPITPVKAPYTPAVRFDEAQVIKNRDFRSETPPEAPVTQSKVPVAAGPGVRRLRRRSTEPVMPNSQRRDSSSSDSYEESRARRKRKASAAEVAGVVGVAGFAAAVIAQRTSHPSSSPDSLRAEPSRPFNVPDYENNNTILYNSQSRDVPETKSHGRDTYPTKAEFDDDEETVTNQHQEAASPPQFTDPHYDTAGVRTPSVASTSSPLDDQSPAQSPQRRSSEHQIETVVVVPKPSEGHSGEPICDDDLYNPDLFRNRARQPSPQRIAETERPDETPDDVFADLKDRYDEQSASQANFFVPSAILAERSEGKTRRAPSFDRSDPGGPTYPMDTNWAFENPRPVPRLKVIPPTPPRSKSPDRSRAASTSPTSIEDTRKREDSPERKSRSSDRRVQWNASPTNSSKIQTSERRAVTGDQDKKSPEPSQGESVHHDNTDLQRPFDEPRSYGDDVPRSERFTEDEGRAHESGLNREVMNEGPKLPQTPPHDDYFGPNETEQPSPPQEEQVDEDIGDTKDSRVRFALPREDSHKPETQKRDEKTDIVEIPSSQPKRDGKYIAGAAGAFAAAAMSAKTMSDARENRSPQPGRQVEIDESSHGDHSMPGTFESYEDGSATRESEDTLASNKEAASVENVQSRANGANYGDIDDRRTASSFSKKGKKSKSAKAEQQFAVPEPESRDSSQAKSVSFAEPTIIGEKNNAEDDWTASSSGKRSKKDKKSRKKLATFEDNELEAEQQATTEEKSPREAVASDDWKESSTSKKGKKEKKEKKSKRVPMSWEDAEPYQQRQEAVHSDKKSTQDDETSEKQHAIAAQAGNDEYPSRSEEWRPTPGRPPVDALESDRRDESEIGTTSHIQATKLSDLDVSESPGRPRPGPAQPEDSFYDIEANAPDHTLMRNKEPAPVEAIEQQNSNESFLGDRPEFSYNEGPRTKHPEFVPLPDSRPISPGDLASVADKTPPLQTSFTTPSSSTRSPSSTAIPLRFRRPPQSPGMNKDSPMQEQTPVFSEPIMPFRPRQNRPASTEFKSSTEFRPLYLLERNTKMPEPAETLPSLPSSRNTSRSGSVQESSADLYESAPESPSSEHGSQPDYFRSFSHEPNAHVEYLDSGQSTPKARRLSDDQQDPPSFSFLEEDIHSSAATRASSIRDHYSSGALAGERDVTRRSDTDNLLLAEAGASEFGFGTVNPSGAPPSVEREVSAPYLPQPADSVTTQDEPIFRTESPQEMSDVSLQPHEGPSRALTEDAETIESVSKNDHVDSPQTSTDTVARNAHNMSKLGKRKGKRKDSKKPKKNRRASSPDQEMEPLVSRSQTTPGDLGDARHGGEDDGSDGRRTEAEVKDRRNHSAEHIDQQSRSRVNDESKPQLWQSQDTEDVEDASKRQSWLLASGAALTAAMATTLPEDIDEEIPTPELSKGLGIDMQPAAMDHERAVLREAEESFQYEQEPSGATTEHTNQPLQGQIASRSIAAEGFPRSTADLSPSTGPTFASSDVSIPRPNAAQIGLEQQPNVQEFEMGDTEISKRAKHSREELPNGESSALPFIEDASYVHGFEESQNADVVSENFEPPVASSSDQPLESGSVQPTTTSENDESSLSIVKSKKALKKEKKANRKNSRPAETAQLTRDKTDETNLVDSPRANSLQEVDMSAIDPEPIAYAGIEAPMAPSAEYDDLQPLEIASELASRDSISQPTFLANEDGHILSLRREPDDPEAVKEEIEVLEEQLAVDPEPYELPVLDSIQDRRMSVIPEESVESDTPRGAIFETIAEEPEIEEQREPEGSPKIEQVTTPPIGAQQTDLLQLDHSGIHDTVEVVQHPIEEASSPAMPGSFPSTAQPTVPTTTTGESDVVFDEDAWASSSSKKQKAKKSRAAQASISDELMRPSMISQPSKDAMQSLARSKSLSADGGQPKVPEQSPMVFEPVFSRDDAIAHDTSSNAVAPESLEEADFAIMTTSKGRKGQKKKRARVSAEEVKAQKSREEQPLVEQLPDQEFNTGNTLVESGDPSPAVVAQQTTEAEKMEEALSDKKTVAAGEVSRSFHETEGPDTMSEAQAGDLADVKQVSEEEWATPPKKSKKASKNAKRQRLNISSDVAESLNPTPGTTGEDFGGLHSREQDGSKFPGKYLGEKPLEAQVPTENISPNVDDAETMSYDETNASALQDYSPMQQTQETLPLEASIEAGDNSTTTYVVETSPPEIAAGTALHRAPSDTLVEPLSSESHNDKGVTFQEPELGDDKDIERPQDPANEGVLSDLSGAIAQADDEWSVPVKTSKKQKKAKTRRKEVSPEEPPTEGKPPDASSDQAVSSTPITETSAQVVDPTDEWSTPSKKSSKKDKKAKKKQKNVTFDAPSPPEGVSNAEPQASLILEDPAVGLQNTDVEEDQTSSSEKSRQNEEAQQQLQQDKSINDATAMPGHAEAHDLHSQLVMTEEGLQSTSDQLIPEQSPSLAVKEESKEALDESSEAVRSFQAPSSPHDAEMAVVAEDEWSIPSKSKPSKSKSKSKRDKKDKKRLQTASIDDTPAEDIMPKNDPSNALNQQGEYAGTEPITQSSDASLLALDDLQRAKDTPLQDIESAPNAAPHELTAEDLQAATTDQKPSGSLEPDYSSMEAAPQDPRNDPELESETVGDWTASTSSKKKKDKKAKKAAKKSFLSPAAEEIPAVVDTGIADDQPTKLDEPGDLDSLTDVPAVAKDVQFEELYDDTSYTNEVRKEHVEDAATDEKPSTAFSWQQTRKEPELSDIPIQQATSVEEPETPTDVQQPGHVRDQSDAADDGPRDIVGTADETDDRNEPQEPAKPSKELDSQPEFSFVTAKNGKKGRKGKNQKQKQKQSEWADRSAEGSEQATKSPHLAESAFEEPRANDTKDASAGDDQEARNLNSISVDQDAASQMAAIIAAEDAGQDVSATLTTDEQQDAMPSNRTLEQGQTPEAPAILLEQSPDHLRDPRSIESDTVKIQQPDDEEKDNPVEDASFVDAALAPDTYDLSDVPQPEPSMATAKSEDGLDDIKSSPNVPEPSPEDEWPAAASKQTKTSKEKRKAKKAKKATLKDLEAQQGDTDDPVPRGTSMPGVAASMRPLLLQDIDEVSSEPFQRDREKPNSEFEKAELLHSAGALQDPQQALSPTNETASRLGVGSKTSNADADLVATDLADVRSRDRPEVDDRDYSPKRESKSKLLENQLGSKPNEAQPESVEKLPTLSGVSFDDVITAGLGAAGFEALKTRSTTPPQEKSSTSPDNRADMIEFGHTAERDRSSSPTLRKGSPSQMWQAAGSPRGRSPEMTASKGSARDGDLQFEELPEEVYTSSKKRRKATQAGTSVGNDLVNTSAIGVYDRSETLESAQEPEAFVVKSKKEKKKKKGKKLAWNADGDGSTTRETESSRQEPANTDQRQSQEHHADEQALSTTGSEQRGKQALDTPAVRQSSSEKYRDSGIHIQDLPDAPQDQIEEEEARPSLYRDSGFDETKGAPIESEDRNADASPRTPSPCTEAEISVSPSLRQDHEPAAREDQARPSVARSQTFDLEQAEQGYGNGEELYDQSRSVDSPTEYQQQVSSPVESTTKNRTSYLFQSSNKSRNVSEDSTQRGGIVHQRISSIETELSRPPEQPEMIEPPAAKYVLGLENDDQSVGQVEGSRTLESSSGQVSRPMDLEPIVEGSREPSPTAKHQRSTSDVGTPEHGVKSQRQSSLEITDDRVTPRSFQYSPMSNSRSSAGSELANIKRTKRRSTSNESTSALGYIRSYSAAENRSNTPSVVSNRSGTPTLRRVDRSVSSDLRAANKRDAKQADDAKSDTPTSSSVIERPQNYAPLKGNGKDRRQDMSGNDAGVFVSDELRYNQRPLVILTDHGSQQGWGDAQGSPRSPTRPPSLRKRQSMHISELETKLDEVLAENRALQKSSGTTRTLGNLDEDATPSRDRVLQEKDVEIQTAYASLQTLQDEVARLTEQNATLVETNEGLSSDTGGKYATMQAEHERSREGWRNTQMELQDLRARHDDLNTGMDSTVRQSVDNAMRAKNAEINSLRGQLSEASDRIKSLQQQITSSRGGEDFLQSRSEEYFDNACQQLCQHVLSWVKRFSKVSDMRACRSSSRIGDENIETRLDNAMLDGTNVDAYLSDRQRRREIFTSLFMTVIWEYVFTRYLFGLERDQRQKLKVLEKTLSEVGPPRAIAQWRATTLTLLSRRDAFVEECNTSSEAVVQEIFGTLSRILPPPSKDAHQLQDSLRRVVSAAVDLSIEMRTQRAEYVMLPPFQPEFDLNGDLKRRIYFNASLMNERSENAEDMLSADELEETSAVVRLVLFPLVVKKGEDDGESGEEIVICPAQVVVAGAMNPPRKGRSTSGMSGGAMSVGGSGGGERSANASMLDVNDMV
ncbi:MAG: hypothetical protein M1828_003460 [Chrysothrix sp. TS-e1954]|nr:MAG: hypothetical protein M1828_003460 [Chrysothrix sp. TS-e1954]